ncbi:hypothetical protein [Segetibacter aerophilus]|uniref:Uncharacterized protein n=1 Tax=Segetibacter aerophilus TaxID=670293 RepID=A0A512BBL4_9BACT|nr:hypothetical protein [Segetibacter aerophilus]GEO09227.1 hypothetical protein SAE01_17230 [Segetibacter aerophilus]
MKKLFTNLLLAVLLYGFSSATPATCIGLVKVPNISKTYVSADYEIKVQKEVEFQVHPLDILAFRFR